LLQHNPPTAVLTIFRLPESILDVLTAEERATDLLESSYSVVVKLADQQADINSPLYSAQSFEDLGL
jgi:hypothetical protein